MDKRGSSAPRPSGDASCPLVAALVYDGLYTFGFGIAAELFAQPRPEFDRWYRFAVAAAQQGPLHAEGGIRVVADGGLSVLSEADLILVPGWRDIDAPVPRALVDSLRAAHARGARIASICTGAFVLAEAGLLDGRRATMHWRHVDAFIHRFPRVQVEPDVLFVDEGDVLTSAGSAAGLDLGLHIIRKDFGATYANSVARRLVISASREGGQRQFISHPVARHHAGRIAPLLDRIRGTLAEDWPVTRMASVAGLSPRSLVRRFHEATGTTPHAWLTSERVTRAADLLETTEASMANVAEAIGFGSPETFRREFKRARGITPSHHKRMFHQMHPHGTTR